MTVQEYVNGITGRYRSGSTSAEICRAYLKILIESHATNPGFANGPAESACGTPAFILTNGNVPTGYVVTRNLKEPTGNREQDEIPDLFRRSLANLMVTNCIDFHLYRDGLPASSVSVAELGDCKILPKPGNYNAARSLIREFLHHKSILISSAADLSGSMAGKAKLLACTLEDALTRDEREGIKSLKERLADVDMALKADIPAGDLANIYAQTISFGMLAARLNGGSALKEFTIRHAAEFIPEPYAALKKLFRYLAGPDLDERLAWIIDELAALFGATDISEVLDDFRKTAGGQDPLIVFTESFLNGYDPELLDSQGGINKQAPIVAFIAEAVRDYAW